MTEDYPVTTPYFSELYGSLQSRPGDFMSQCGDGNTEYPANSREIHLNNLLTINEARPSDPRVRKYSAHPPMNPREEYFPEVFWDMNRLRHTHQKPADKRRQDEQQASHGRMVEDVPSKRTRLDSSKECNANLSFNPRPGNNISSLCTVKFPLLQPTL